MKSVDGKVRGLALAVIALFVPAALFAQETVPPMNSGDTAWILVSAALVLLMTVPALAMFYGGLVKKKNIINTMYFSFAAAIIVSILWVAVQYSAIFNANEIIPGILGAFDKAFMNGVKAADQGMRMPWVGANAAVGVPENVFSMYQMTFAIITVALVAGAVAERMRFGAWLLFVILWTLLVYTPLAHWVWGGGFLAKMGVLDFAGGLVVHVSSGVSGLVAALMIGKRKSKEETLPGNIPFVAIGAALLWVGWFGFNAGSAIGANGLAGNAFMVTNTAAAVGGLTWFVLDWIFTKKPTIIGAASGLIAGLASITPAAGFVTVPAAMAIGLGGSLLCYFMVAVAKKALKYDDALDAFGIHGISGIWGMTATGIFASSVVQPAFKGLLEGNAAQLGIQLLSVLIGIVLSVVGTVIVLFIVRIFTPWAVEAKVEDAGLDYAEHGEAVE
jgi:Amt family ammonium transporter